MSLDFVPPPVDLSSYAKSIDVGNIYATKAQVVSRQTSVYSNYAVGPATTGATATASLIPVSTSSTAVNGSLTGLPLIYLGAPGAYYTSTLHGNYSLAAATPGNVTAYLKLGSTSWSTVIANLVAGTNGAWWDAQADFYVASVSGTTAMVAIGATLTFQATGGVTAAQAIERGTSPSNVKAVTIDANGMATFDLQRNFTNTANTMQIETLCINRIN